MKKLFAPFPVFIILLYAIGCGPARHSAAPGLSFDPYNYSGNKRLVVSNAAVVSAHPLASKAGMEMLRRGGNAMDAMIATQLALAVVYPNAGNLGGGGFTVARFADGSLLTLDYREMGPARAHRDMYIDPDGTARTDKSQNGHLSAGVPGTVAGLFAAHKHARLPFRELIAPAIELAEKGFVITAREASSLNGIQDELRLYNTASSAFVRPLWEKGDTLIQRDLARTLARIRDKGQAGFYEGETAQLIVAEMKRGKGILSAEDLKSYKAIERKPHIFDYKGYRVVGMPMPSSGGLLLNQMMKMIEKRNIAAMGFHSPEAVQLMAEVERRAFADRGVHMGDADFYNVPVKAITSENYLASRMQSFIPGKATPSSTLGAGQVIPGTEETTHISVIDKEGNAIAVTTTLNNSYGSKTVVGGAGFFLNDEMDDFSIKPGVPNMYGAIGGEANAIAPGKRILSSMTPTLVLKDNKPFIVVGTPGGTTIPTSVFQTLVNLLEFNLSPEEAVNRPKFHHQWLPDSLQVEKEFPETLRESLRKMGYTVRQRSPIGRTELIYVLPDGRFEAIADKRGDDSVEGF